MMLERYREMEITTASPEMLVVKLYEGAVRNALQAREHVEAGRSADRSRTLSKAIAIVSELQRVLDVEQGGEIGQNLYDLYDFVITRLVDANLEDRIDCIDEAVGVLSTLEGAFREIAKGPVP